ncbi:LysM and putative peptidoglycan-binding domain-containing protein 3 [Trichinella papuae]|uniref:Negative elongation factor E n=1 Tax=Trichinella papuae TaxID=268474 RepID=A0A0V1M9C1_9BILA|nr:LysM and putative peptidoglycan-binding domain-containing protein 3 [Trichinella papuae]
MTEMDNDSIELRSRVNNKHLRSNSKERREKNHECNQFVVYHMCAGDTIQKIALKHNISVNELKRVNNLLSDQDIYALKMIRIPVHRFSFLTDSYKVSNDSASGKIDSPVISAAHISSTDSISMHGEKQKLRDDHAHAKNDIIDLLSEVDQNVQRVKEKHNQQNSKEVRQLQEEELFLCDMSSTIKKLKLLSNEDLVFKSGPVKNPTKYENSLREVFKTIDEQEKEILRLSKIKEKSKKEIEMEAERIKEELKTKVRNGDLIIAGNKIKESFKKPLSVQRRLEKHLSPEELAEKAQESSQAKTVKPNENVVVVEGIDLSLGTLYRMLSKMGTIVKMSKTLNGLSVYCEFDSRESAILAQATVRLIFHFLNLVEEMAENAGNGQCIIQVKGRDLTGVILNSAFGHLGRIRNTCVSRNRTTAILVFEKEEAAQMAVDVMNGVIIGKDSVTISMFPDIKEKTETLKDDLTESKPVAAAAADDDDAAAAAELDSVAPAEPNPNAACTKPRDVVVAYVRAYKLTVEMLYEGFHHFDDIVNLFLTDMRFDCLIEYKTSEQAYIALNTMNGHLLQNLILQISLLQENASRSGEHGQRDSNFPIASGKTISVRTKVFLPANVILPAFQVFGDIVQYTFERNYSGGFVEFVNPACVSRACSEMNGKYLEDMKLITSVFVFSPHTNFNCLADPAMLDVEVPIAVPFKWLVTTFSPFGRLTYVCLEADKKSALIAYQSMESSKIACMELNGLCFEGGILRVNFHNESVMLDLRSIQEDTGLAVSEPAAANVNADFLKEDGAVNAEF